MTIIKANREYMRTYALLVKN